MTDKRKVSTDALETLGTILGGKDDAGRDAIHLAVEPAIAVHRLLPGADVGFVDGGVGVCSNPVGIVDPFLKSPVAKGQKFWLVVYPRQITSLRHVWEHPAFPSSETARPDVSSSERWLRSYADDLDTGYRSLMNAAENWINRGDFFIEGGKFEGVHLDEEFWVHYAAVTGRAVPEKRQVSFFACSC